MPEPKKPAKPTNQQPVPRGLGGLDLSALADAGHAESRTRIGGQSALLQNYLDSNLGLQQAGFQADSERDQRLAQVRRSMALLEEAVNNQRSGQQSALARERMKAAAGDAAAQRDFEEQMAREDLIAELSAIATLEDDLVPERQTFGRNEVNYARGGALSGGKQAEIRNKVFEEAQAGSQATGLKLGPVTLPFGGGGGLFGGAGGGRDARPAVTYDSLLEEATGMYDEFLQDPDAQMNPMAFVAQIRQLFRNDPMAASLALRDLGADFWDAGQA